MIYKFCFDQHKRVWTFSDLLVRWSRLPTVKILRPADQHSVSVLAWCHQWLYLLAWRHPLLCMCQLVPSVIVPSAGMTLRVCRLSCSVSVGAVSDCTSCHDDTEACCLAVYQLVLSVTVPLAGKTLRYADCHAVYQLVLSVTVPLAVKTLRYAVMQCISWCCQWLYLLPWRHWGMLTVMQCISWCCQWLYLLLWRHWGMLSCRVSVAAGSGSPSAVEILSCVNCHAVCQF